MRFNEKLNESHAPFIVMKAALTSRFLKDRITYEFFKIWNPIVPNGYRKISAKEARELIAAHGLVVALDEGADGKIWDTPQRSFLNNWEGVTTHRATRQQFRAVWDN